MALIHLSLQGATGITAAVSGKFTGSPKDEILVVRGRNLELIRPNSSTCRLEVLSSQTLDAISCMVSFKLATENEKGMRYQV